jgi:hypothetical protein
MFLNIITPCTRPQNLHAIAQSISDTIPRDNYRWIVVFDASEMNITNLPENAEYYAVRVQDSISGNGQRNYAIDLVQDGHVYFNDDDTTIHPDLWSAVSHFDDAEFISFRQVHKNGAHRLEGKYIKVGGIDSHNFIVKHSVIGPTRWILGAYCADGYFASEVYNNSTKIVYVDRVLSVYNSLRG